MADAIQRGATEDLREELGDLLLQVVFHARMAEEAGLFDFGGVVEAITTKLIRRHPHVFGDVGTLNSDDVKALWGRIKAEEKREKLGPGAKEAAPSALDGVPLALPALTRALKLQEKAGKVGFDWNDVRAVPGEDREEVVEVEAEIAAGSRAIAPSRGRRPPVRGREPRTPPQLDPETALRGANANSNGASPISSVVWRSAARLLKPQALMKWSGYGSRPRATSRRGETHASSRGGHTRLLSRLAEWNRQRSAGRSSPPRGAALPPAKRRLTRSTWSAATRTVRRRPASSSRRLMTSACS